MTTHTHTHTHTHTPPPHTHTHRLTQENDGLKQAYAELEEKYAPYQETIDKLEAQNKLLTSQTAAAQQEAQRLSEQYAKLLGHQNTRQKIMHVKNLKDENAALKQVRNNGHAETFL